MQPRSSRCWLVAVAAAVLVGLPLVIPAGLSEAAGPPGRGERAEGPPPKPLVLQFRHIPAESFLDTLKQLGRNPQVGEALEQIPMALNQPANAVVVLAPPEAAEFLITIAKGLDQPNEFRAIMMQQEQQEMELRMRAEAARRQMASPPAPGWNPAPSRMVPGGPQPGRQMGPGPREGPRPGAPALRPGQGRPLLELLERRRTPTPQPFAPRPEARPGQPREGPRPGQAMPPRRPEAPPEGRGPARESAAPAPGPMLRQFWALVSPEVRQKFDISEEQADRIRAILTEAARGMADVMERVQGAMRDVPPEKRPVAVREWLQKNAPDRLRQMEEIREQILRVLSPPQRERAQQWLREHAAESLREQPRPEAPAPPRREPGQGLRGRDGPPGAPAAGESPARFFLAEEAGGPPPGAGGPPPGMGGQRGGPPPWAGMMQNMISPEDQERIREMVRQGQSLRYLEDPDVRNDLKITPQQEKRIQELRERATGLVSAISEDLRARFQDRTPPPDMTDEQRQAFMQEMAKAVADTVRGSLNEFEGMLGEVNTLLTDEQKALLRQIGPMRAQSDQLTGGLSYLTTSQAREEFAFTYDQAERIKMIVRDVEVDVKKLLEEIAGPGKQPTPEELRGEKFAPFREGQKEMVKKGLDRIMTILTGEQRDKVQKWSETRMGRTSRQQGMRGRRGGPGGGQPGGGPEGPRPGGPPEGRPPGPPPGGARAAPWQPPATLAVSEAPPQFRLAQDVSDGPPVEKPRKTEKVRRNDDEGPPVEKPHKTEKVRKNDDEGPPVYKGDKGGPPRDEMAERLRQFDFGQMAGLIRTLADPEVREKLRLTPDQERKIAELEDRGRMLGQKLRDEVISMLGPPGVGADFTAGEREARGAAVQNVMSAAKREFQDLANEASSVLTEEQKAQLKEMGRQRQQADMATGGLMYLTTPQARQEFGFSYDQAERIKMIVRDVEADARKLQDEAFGPGAKPPAPAELKGEKYAPLREQHKEMLRKALDRIMTLLTGTQREKVQKWSATRSQAGGGPRPVKKSGKPQAEPPTRGYDRGA